MRQIVHPLPSPLVRRPFRRHTTGIWRRSTCFARSAGL